MSQPAGALGVIAFGMVRWEAQHEQGATANDCAWISVLAVFR
jgi:hypothetical protein